MIVTDGLAGSTRSINAWLLNAAGKLLAGPVVLYSTTSVIETTSLILAPNGDLLIAWTENLFSNQIDKIARALRFRAK